MSKETDAISFQPLPTDSFELIDNVLPIGAQQLMIQSCTAYENKRDSRGVPSIRARHLYSTWYRLHTEGIVEKCVQDWYGDSTLPIWELPERYTERFGDFVHDLALHIAQSKRDHFKHRLDTAILAKDLLMSNPQRFFTEYHKAPYTQERFLNVLDDLLHEISYTQNAEYFIHAEDTDEHVQQFVQDTALLLSAIAQDPHVQVHITATPDTCCMICGFASEHRKRMKEERVKSTPMGPHCVSDVMTIGDRVYLKRLAARYSVEEGGSVYISGCELFSDEFYTFLGVQ